MPGSPRTAPARLPWPGYDSMDGSDRRASHPAAVPRPADPEKGTTSTALRIDAVAAAAALPPPLPAARRSLAARVRAELAGDRPPGARPPRGETHAVLFTPVLAAVTAVVFAFSAGGYGNGGGADTAAATPSSCLAPASPPSLLAGWATQGHVAGAAPWCRPAPATPWTLDGSHLALWGGLLPGAGLPPPRRVFAAALLHASASHWAANAALTLALGAPLERAHGAAPVAAAWVAAVAGGALLAAAAEAACVVVVGASGGAFGLAAAAAVDAVVAFPVLPRPVLHVACLAGSLAALVAAAAAAPAGTSHWSHGGGTLAGAAAAALLFSITAPRRKSVRLVVAGVGCVVLAASTSALSPLSG